MFWQNTRVGDRNILFQKIFRDYYPSLLYFSIRILNDKHSAEDVVQDVFMNMWRGRALFENELSLKAYLYLSVRNRSLDLLKKKAPVYTDISQYEEIAQEADMLVREEAFRLLDEAIEHLPEKTRQVIRLSLENYSVNQVAEELNITPNTVKTHKQRAYRFLREYCSGALFMLFIAMPGGYGKHNSFVQSVLKAQTFEAWQMSHLPAAGKDKQHH